MSKAKFAAAKELIDEKQYDAARNILKTIDHPTAREWEAKLDTIAPPVINTVQPTGNRYIYNVVRAIVVMFIIVVVLIVIVSQIQKTSKELATGQQAVVDALTTVNSPAASNPAGTSTALSVAIKETANAQPTTSNTDALTIAASTTATPSPTITDTPIPSATSTLTVAPTFTIALPTATPIKLAFSGTNAKVFGPMDIPQGIYRAVFTTNGYGSVALSASNGECGADMSGFMVPNLFLIMRGQASSGAEAILKSTGCTTLIQISNVTEAWTLLIELVG